MKAYELLYFVAPKCEDETRKQIETRIDSVVKEGNGTVSSTEAWERRKLAYTIDDLTDGDYYLVKFDADETIVAELDRVLRISDNVVRHMICACEE